MKLSTFTSIKFINSMHIQKLPATQLVTEIEVSNRLYALLEIACDMAALKDVPSVDGEILALGIQAYSAHRNGESNAFSEFDEIVAEESSDFALRANL
jgi:hypothetical protein